MVSYVRLSNWEYGKWVIKCHQGGTGHQKSFKVTIQGRLNIYEDLTEHFDRACVRYRWESF